MGPGRYPQYTRADFGPEAVGSSVHNHYTSPKVKPYGRVQSRKIAKLVSIQMRMTSFGRNVSSFFGNDRNHTRTHTSRSALRGRSHVVVHRIVKQMAKAFTFAFSLVTPRLPPGLIAVNKNDAQKRQELKGTSQRSHQRLPEVTGQPESSRPLQSWDSSERVQLKTSKRRGVEQHPVQDTRAPKRQSARRSTRAWKQLK